MKTRLQIFLFVLTFARWIECHNDELLLVDSIRRDFLRLEDDLWSFVLQQNKDNSVDPGIELIKLFHDFDKVVQKMPQDMLYGMQTTRKAEHFLIFFSDVRVIHDMYDKFRRYLTDNLSSTKKDYSEYRREITTSDIVDDILHDKKNNVNKTTWQIYNQTSVLIYDLLNIISDKGYICNNPTQPSQLVLYNFYNLVALTELKGYILSQFAYMALRLQETGNYTKSSITARNEYRKKVTTTFQIFKGIMDLANEQIYRCDPKTHIEGKTYDQVTRLIQAHIQNEADLNPTQTCTETCSKYTSTKSYGCYDNTSDYCKNRQPCTGDIYNCRFIESHFKTCVSTQSSHRRYDYIEYNEGRVFGEKTRCASERTVNSWFRWFVHCSYCLCFCDEQGAKSERYFNLRPTMADVDNQRVVTGMRFIKHNRMFYIQIQEGKLLPRAYIDQDTVRWVPVDQYSILDHGVAKGVDYHMMDYNHRSMSLDNLDVPGPNYTITGVRFILVNGDLQFQITVTPFNFTTGKLYTDGSYQVTNFYNIRHKISFNQPDIPVYSPPSEPNFDSHRFVEFTNTDLDKDAAQTTVPFMDIQPVNAEPAVPLKSAGIYYKGRPGFGGFVGIKIETYDYRNNFQFDFPPRKDREESGDVFEMLIN